VDGYASDRGGSGMVARRDSAEEHTPTPMRTAIYGAVKQSVQQHTTVVFKDGI
jgi:hypothetical protein